MRKLALVVAALAVLACKGKTEEVPDKQAEPPSPAKSLQPDPRYPTAKSSGTEGIFTLEEPERGSLVTSPVAAPRNGKLSEHSHCELDHREVVCGPNGKGWKVTRTSTQIGFQRIVAGKVAKTIVVDKRKDGSTERIVEHERGVVISSRHFDSAGTKFSARLRSGANALPGCGAIQLEVGAGKVSSATCLQWMGKPMRDSNGVSKTELARDKSGFVVERRYFDPKGEPTAGHDGVHKVVIERDAQGRPVAERHQGMDGKPSLSGAHGCATLATSYGPDGQPVEIGCLGTSGKPALDSRGVAVSKISYDRRGCRNGERYLNTMGTSVKSRFHGFGINITNDESCRPTTEQCVNVEGKIGVCADAEYAAIRSRRNAEGEVISRRYYGIDAGPGVDPVYSVFEVRIERDERGRQVGESCWDKQGNAIECANTGYHASKSKLDDAGRDTVTHFFAPDGSRTDNLGTFEARHVHDNYDHLYETTYLDKNGKPAGSMGASTRRHIYDAGHRVFAVLMYLDGKPADFRACYTGRTCPPKPWHAVRVERDPTGAVTKNLFFDSGERLVGEIDCKKKRCFGQ